MKITLTDIDGDRSTTTLAQFLSDNPDTTTDELADIYGTLANGYTYTGGGGAAPEWSVELTEDSAEARAIAAERSRTLDCGRETMEDLEAKLAHDEAEAAHRARLERIRKRSQAFGVWYMETIPASLQPAVEPWSRLLRDAFEAGAKAAGRLRGFTEALGEYNMLSRTAHGRGETSEAKLHLAAEILRGFTVQEQECLRDVLNEMKGKV